MENSCVWTLAIEKVIQYFISGDYLLQFVKISFTIHLGERGDIAQRDLLFGESKERCDAISEELIDSGMMSVEMFNARGLISQKLSHLYK